MASGTCQVSFCQVVFAVESGSNCNLKLQVSTLPMPPTPHLTLPVGQRIVPAVGSQLYLPLSHGAELGALG